MADDTSSLVEHLRCLLFFRLITAFIEFVCRTVPALWYEPQPSSHLSRRIPAETCHSRVVSRSLGRYGAARSAAGCPFRNLQPVPFSTSLHANTHQSAHCCQFINFIDVTDGADNEIMEDETMGGEKDRWGGK